MPMAAKATIVANPIIFNRKLPKKILTALVVFGFCCLFLGFVRDGTALADTNVAIDNTAPTPNSGTDGAGNDFTPLTGVGHDSNTNSGFNGVYTWYKIYVPLGDATTITINQVCKDVGTPTVKYWIESLSDNETTYSGSKGNANNTWISNPKTSSDCNQNPTINIGGGGPNVQRGVASAVAGHQNYRVFAFIAQILPGPNQYDERYFRVSSDDNKAFIGLATKDVACHPNTNNCTIPLKFSTIYKPKSTDLWEATVMFAPGCGDNPSGNYDIKIYDPDNGIYQNNMHATLEASKAHPINWSQVKSWDANAVQGNYVPPQTPVANPWGKSGTTGTLSYGNYDNNVAYKFHIIGAKYPNTIQIQLPFDQFNASPQNAIGCTHLSCTATPNYQGDPKTVQVVVTNNSPYKWGKGYQVREQYLPDPPANPVLDGPYGQNWPSLSSNPPSDGFSTDIAANGGTKTSTNSTDPATNKYFHKPASATVQFVLYDDNGNGATKLDWDDGQPCVANGGSLTINCGSGTLPSTIPGGQVTSNYTYTVKNTTGIEYLPGDGYHAVATPVPGLANPVGVSNDIPIAIPNGTNNSSPPLTRLDFHFVVNYQGSYSVRFFDPDNNPIGSPDPCPGVTISPSVSPYFQAWQNDAAAGGGFKTEPITCPGSTGGNYPTNVGYVSPTTTDNDYSGGIIANSSNFQSKSDFGAVALGLIPFASGEGFYSPHNTYFANSLTGTYAADKGYLNSTSSNHCVRDYYTETKTSTNPNPEPSLEAAIAECQAEGLHSCQFALAGNNLNQTPGVAVTFPKHLQITIYALGNVTISSNIAYQEPFNPNDTADIPYFALITQGKVTLTNGVTRLDGLYVVQPTPNDSGGINDSSGVFATCDNSSCNQQLVVNGAVIAQQVQLLRAHGSSETLSPDPVGIGNAPAEIFNFVPSMVLGAPAFASKVSPQRAYSIAPVF